jgi:hypothetical protein
VATASPDPPALSVSAYYFLVSLGGETQPGEGHVITVDHDGGVTTRGFALDEARARVQAASSEGGYREVYLLAHESEPALYEYRSGAASRLEPFRPDSGARARLSPLANMA